MNWRVHTPSNYCERLHQYIGAKYFKTKKEAVAYAETFSNAQVEKKMVNKWYVCYTVNK